MSLRTEARPSGGYATMMTLAAGATFLAILDATVANLAVADLGNTFRGAASTDFTWVISLYAITFAAFLAPAGRLADALGRRTLYLGGVGLFTVMSALCAFAPSLPVLLAARAVQGVGAAAMIPASLAVVLMDCPPKRRVASIGLWSAAGSCAAASGPSVGGLLINAFSWRAVFLISVPLGLGLMAAGWRVIAGSGDGARRGQLPDIPGVLLLAAGVGLVSLAIVQGPPWGWLSGRTLGTAAAGLLMTAWVIWRSARRAAPAIETQLWKIRTYALANTVSLFYGAALYSWLLAGVLFAVHAWHFSVLTAGLAMSPGSVVSATSGVITGRIGARTGTRLPAMLGALAVIVSATCLILALGSHPSLAVFIGVGSVAGLGFGALGTAVSSAAALSVQPDRFAGATGLNMAARQVGGALGIAALGAILPAVLPDQPGPYLHVLLFCAIAAAFAGAAASGLSLRRPATAAAPAATTPVTAAR